MEALVVLLILFLIWLVVGPLIAIIGASAARKESRDAGELAQSLLNRVRDLERQLGELRKSPAPPPPAEPSFVSEPEVMEPPADEPPIDGPGEQVVPEFNEPALPPPLPRRKLIDYGGDGPPKPPEPAVEAVAKEPFSWEKFMGVKLFAWLGGVAMFFGVIFFVKYAFENNLIPPATRVTLGFVAGAGLLAGGLMTHRLPKYRVLAQAFCATGTLILYGVSFAAHAVYHFAAFGQIPTFILMALITLAAFLIAVRLEALVVAVLGMLGGFLTPVLLSTGHDQVIGLFGYIALLDIGLIAVSRHANWRYLTAAAALGTAILQIGWFERYFLASGYPHGAKTLIPMAIFAGFVVLFLAGVWVGRRRDGRDSFSAGSVVGLAALAILFAFRMSVYPSIAERHFLLYGFLLVINLAVIALVMMRPRLVWAQMGAALLTFLHLAFWSGDYLKPESLHAALALYLVFGSVHAVAPVLLARRPTGEAGALPRLAGPWTAPVVLLLMFLPVIHLDPAPMAVWAGVLMANLLAIGLAALTGAVLPVIASLALTMIVAGAWLLHVPAAEDFLLPFLGVITGFSMLFSLAGRWLVRRLMPDASVKSADALAARWLPVCAGLPPFALLILALARLPVANPSPVFGVALLMSVLLIGLALLGKIGPLVPAALTATFCVEMVWHIRHFQADAPLPALGWYLGFHALFLALPFVFRKSCEGMSLPWISGAMAGVLHFPLVRDLVQRAWPNEMMGLLPAAYALPSLAALFVVSRMPAVTDEVKRGRLAWFGGAALWFITLIFPIQLDRQWLTVGWALEGAALLWLFRRVPHPGLRLTGVFLLGTSFVRLALNPAVFADYPRSGTPILNWHLYTYGIVAMAQFLGARWLTDPPDRLAWLKPRGHLLAMGGVLLFLLLNIEIADYFTAPDDRCVAFRFGGNFARDMTYSIAWGLFALGLLGIGIGRRSAPARFAAVGLLAATLLKLFLHDLAAIGSVFRIGALIGVAVIAFVASFLYQRFFDKSRPS